MSTVREQIARLNATGVSVGTIAARLGLASNTVRYHLAQLERGAQPAAAPAAPRVTDAVSHVRTRDAVAGLLGAGRSRAEVARELGISKSTVSYHARRAGAAIDQRCARRYDWGAVPAFYDEGASVRDCMAAFGFSKQGWHGAVRRGQLVARPAAMPLAELPVAGTYRGREHLKRRLLGAGLKASRCEECGLTDWQGQPIGFALHHVNGDRLDNRLVIWGRLRQRSRGGALRRRRHVAMDDVGVAFRPERNPSSTFWLVYGREGERALPSAE